MGEEPLNVTVGVLALQGAFSEHLQLLRAAATTPPLPFPASTSFNFIAVRTAEQLATCDALILPGGESTTISLIAERSSLLEPLREFVKLAQKPVWGTCAGMILLSERANRTKRGGQQLIGGLDVCVNRNHFGRQVESFECVLDMPFLDASTSGTSEFKGVFIRAPVVEKLLDASSGDESMQADCSEEEVRAPAVNGWRRGVAEKVEILASLPPALDPAETKPVNKHTANPSRALGLDMYGRPQTPGIFGDGFGKDMSRDIRRAGESVLDEGHKVLGREGPVPSKNPVPRGNIVAVRQGNVIGTSFHPELTGDVRMHRWWLGEVVKLLTTAKANASRAQ
ncbi:SNO glutamine amidotransferase family-domain-containing protein [Kalaharituber pfeilii]|nr:SNO glutamine amidotransferase family-domain-containing protein [Kalaharituber pfeilii]